MAVLIGALLISGAILYSGKDGTATIGDEQLGDVTPTPIVNPAELVTANDPILGNPDAKVTIVEFSDFQCPFCRSFFEETFSEIKKQYVDTGKVRIVFRDFPLSFHPAARPAALAAQCAHDQGKFWEFHDKLFIEQAKKGNATIEFGVFDLKTWAGQLGLNRATFDACLDSEQHEDDVQADIDAGTGAGVTGTPSFFVNGIQLVGAQPFAAFKAVIEQELEK